jgi:hypothetical protein
MKCVYQTYNPFEADIVLSKLREAGIEGFRQGDHVAAFMSGHRILVDDGDEKSALKVIEAHKTL